MDRTEAIEALRVRVGRIGRGKIAAGRPLSFGLAAIDARFPDGLPSGALHEVLGAGSDTEYGTLPSLLVGGLLARHGVDRPVLWAMQRCDLFPPGLAAVGLPPRRLILVEGGSGVLAVMEEALRHPGLAAVVGEVEGRFGLTESRRLQLAAEASGVVAFAIRRSRRFDDPALLAPSAANSRWRVATLPSPLPGLASGSRIEPMPDQALWRLELLRARAASPSQWIVQGCDVQGRLAAPAGSGARAPVRVPLAAVLADRSAASRYG